MQGEQVKLDAVCFSNSPYLTVCSFCYSDDELARSLLHATKTSCLRRYPVQPALRAGSCTLGPCVTGNLPAIIEIEAQGYDTSGFEFTNGIRISKEAPSPSLDELNTVKRPLCLFTITS